MYAVVNTGGKQLKVAVGDTVSVEKLDAAPGATVKLDALLVNDGEKIMVGDEAAAIAITGEVVGHGKGDKVIVFKFKKRKGYKKLRGHRQDLTLVKVTDIALGGKKTKKAETEVEAEAKPTAAEKAEKTEAPKKAAAKAAAKPKTEPKAKIETEPAEKPAAQKKAPAAKAAAKPAAEKKAPAVAKPAAKKPTAKKPAAKKPAAPKKEKPAE